MLMCCIFTISFLHAFYLLKINFDSNSQIICTTKNPKIRHTITHTHKHTTTKICRMLMSVKNYAKFHKKTFQKSKIEPKKMATQKNIKKIPSKNDQLKKQKVHMKITKLMFFLLDQMKVLVMKEEFRGSFLCLMILLSLCVPTP